MPAAVLIVNFHAYEDLGNCLRSLDGKLAPDDEIVVVDYESDAAALARAIAGHPRVKTIARSDNRGFAAGINIAARASSAPYLLLLNPDTVVEGPVVRVLEDWLRAHPDTGVVGPRLLNSDGTVQPSARRFPGPSTAIGGRTTWATRMLPNNRWSRRNLVALQARGPVDVDWLSGACLMTRRDLFDQLGGLDEAFFLYWEDADYCRRLSDAGSRCTYVPAVVVRHAGGTSAAYDVAGSTKAFHASAYRFYRKYAGGFGRAAAPVVWAGLWMRGQWLKRRGTP